MTTNTSPEFDRLMAAWLEADSHVRVPETLLDGTLARTSSRRPLPAWLLPERWLPVELTMRRAQVPRAVPYLLLLGVLVLLVAVAALIVGSQRRIPAPFGPAANGTIAFATEGGDVATVDPVTGVTTMLVTGPEVERYPVFSLDGTRIAFVRRTAAGDDLYVVDASSRALTKLTDRPLPTTGDTGLLAWSPDGTRLAFHEDGKLWIARTDTADVRRVDLGFPIDSEIEWRPPDGREIAVRGTGPTGAGIYLVPLDGAGMAHAITPTTGFANDYLWLSWSPDGTRLAYHIHGDRHVELLAIGQPEPTVIRPVDGYGLMFPRFSPDGTRLAVMTWLPDSRVQVGVLAADDPTPEVTLTGPTFAHGIQFDWSPDGTEILVVEWGSDQPWVLDPGGGPGRETSWRIRVPDWVEWQRLAR